MVAQMIRAILILQLCFFTWGGMFTAHTIQEKHELEMVVQKLIYMPVAQLSYEVVRM